MGCDKDPVTPANEPEPEPEPFDCTGLTEVELWGGVYTVDIGITALAIREDLTGSIPPEIGCLTNLTLLDLNGNQLTGSIPPEIGNLTNLEWLSLYNNQLTGEIPPEIGQLTNLTHLYLGDNELTGEIPPEIGNLTNLTWLDLTNNQLTGEIPCALFENNNWLSGWNFQGNILYGNNLIPEVNTCE